MASSFADIVDFVTVYIEEAHAEDGWKFDTNEVQILKHRSLSDRFAAATILADIKDELPFPVLVDNMNNDTNRAYGGLYERLYILLDNRVVYVGGVGPTGYHPHEVAGWLGQYRKQINA